MKIAKLLPLFISLIFNDLKAQILPPGEIALELRKLNTVGSVLYVAAHPDDENTRLISWLANEKCVRTGYLSITRGDGGQNLIGKEQGDLLGLIRTQELIAARRKDGGEQFFTRAVDFGYSKNPEETFAIWGKDSILKDVVYTIRKFRPDVIICRFGTDGSGGHGHHTASAMLAEEAFDLAGDPTKFPELNSLAAPWKPKLLAWNFWQDRTKMGGKTARMEVGSFQPLLGKSFGEIAAESRSMHKSQGFGVARNRGETFEYFKILKGDCDTNQLFSGLDFSWKRLAGGAELEKLLQKAEQDFQFRNPHLSVPLLLKAYQLFQNLPDAHWKSVKMAQLEKIIFSCLGLHAEAAAEDYSTTPGSQLKVQLQMINRSPFSVRLNRISIAGLFDSLTNLSLTNNKLVKVPTWIRIPEKQPVTNPYWLSEAKMTDGLFQVSNPAKVGIPENGPAFSVRFDLEMEGVSIPVVVPLQYKWVEPADGEKWRSLEILPPVTMNLEEKAFVFASDLEKNIRLTVSAHQPAISAIIKPNLPPGWQVSPAQQTVEFAKKGEEQVLHFKIKPLPGATPGPLVFQATVGSQSFAYGLIRLDFPHIPIQTLLSPAKAQLVKINLKTTGKKIGYIQGAGDAVANGLRQVGYEVDELTEDQIMGSNLSPYQAIITGVRLYNVNERTRVFQPKLLDYVKNGGNLIVQYNTNNWISSVKVNIGPYPFTISRERVTKEDAPVQFLLPQNPLMTAPNLLSDKDFEGWVQERGIYFASDLAPEYSTPFSMQDPGEKEQKGSLILAPYGKGNFVYTGLAFFRQIPAGVPGSFRLLSNLIALPKRK